MEFIIYVTYPHVKLMQFYLWKMKSSRCSLPPVTHIFNLLLEIYHVSTNHEHGYRSNFISDEDLALSVGFNFNADDLFLKLITHLLIVSLEGTAPRRTLKFKRNNRCVVITDSLFRKKSFNNKHTMLNCPLLHLNWNDIIWRSHCCYNHHCKHSYSWFSDI